MKGLVHFAAGVAATSCFPFAVEAGANGNPLYFILGGCCGLLPDIIDYRLTKLFYKYDVDIVPDPKNLAATMIADAVASAINHVYETGRSVGVKLNTIRQGPDLWQSYSVRLDGFKQEVTVSFGDVVGAGMRTVPECKRIDDKVAISPINCDVKLDYMTNVSIDIHDGPVLLLEPHDDNSICVKFLPWHRLWSHSVVIALLISLLGALFWGVSAAVVIFVAMALHIALDQMGFMGCNILYPFTKQRTHGFGVIHAMSPFLNLIAVWISILILFWNLARYAKVSWFVINPLGLLSIGLLLPLLGVKLWKMRGELDE